MAPCARDLLASCAWECTSVDPDRLKDPSELSRASLEWLPAAVPGTAAAALRAAGAWSTGTEDEEQLDGRDWWFRCRFKGSETEAGSPLPQAAGKVEETRRAPEEESWELRLGGLASVSDVWLNGEHLTHSDNMFLEHRLSLSSLLENNELVMRFAALTPVLRKRHPRPRWKSQLVRHQSLRWHRTTILGRIPGWAGSAAPVGPWRPVELTARSSAPALVDHTLRTLCEGEGGTVSVRAVLRCPNGTPVAAQMQVAGESAQLAIEQDGTNVIVHGSLRLEHVERWWPHTHGRQPRYPVTLELDGIESPLGSVGFRTVEVDRSDGAFELRVNGIPVFCRGACWSPLDAVSLSVEDDRVHAAVRAVRDAGMNMLRVTAYTCYEADPFWEACDELGILVWQDCMIASVDPPQDEGFAAELERELRQELGRAARHPAIAIVCGSSESYQQAAMLGLDSQRWHSPILEDTIPALVTEILPGVPYVPSSPSGGDLPFDLDSGVAHYFGVGGYMRPLSDARFSNVRFAAECLAFSTPPEPETVEQLFGGAAVAGHDPRWKAAVARDAGTPWDFEDIRDHYVRELFGLDPFGVRYGDPERALDLGRAAVVEAMTTVLAEWRRPQSSCAGAIVLSLRDLSPGAGWGLLDSLGRPKAPWYPLARVLAPQTVTIVDEGLSGLDLHVFNDYSTMLSARLRLTVFTAAGNVVESAERELEVSAHGASRIRAQALLGGFRDLNNAYRFGPSVYDVVLAELEDEQGARIAQAVHLPGGPGRPCLPEVGLESSLSAERDGEWELRVSTRLFAQYVALDVPGFTLSDSWFHLPPAGTHTVTLRPYESDRSPAGTVRALNSLASVRVAAAPASE